MLNFKGCKVSPRLQTFFTEDVGNGLLTRSWYFGGIVNVTDIQEMIKKLSRIICKYYIKSHPIGTFIGCFNLKF